MTDDPNDPRLQRLAELEAIVADVANICRRYGTAASNPGAHALAYRIMERLGIRPSVDRGGVCGRCVQPVVDLSGL